MTFFNYPLNFDLVYLLSIIKCNIRGADTLSNTGIELVMSVATVNILLHCCFTHYKSEHATSVGGKSSFLPSL